MDSNAYVPPADMQSPIAVRDFPEYLPIRFSVCRANPQLPTRVPLSPSH